MFSSAGLARATASATAAVKRGTDAWPKQSARSTHVPRTSSRKSEGVKEARNRLAGASYSNSGPASSSCSGSASSRGRAAADGACASATAGLRFRDFRNFLLMPINKAHATTAKERPAATGTVKDASASERRFGTGDANDGEAVGEAVVSKLRGQISTECQVAVA